MIEGPPGDILMGGDTWRSLVMGEIISHGCGTQVQAWLPHQTIIYPSPRQWVVVRDNGPLVQDNGLNVRSGRSHL